MRSVFEHDVPLFSDSYSNLGIIGFANRLIFKVIDKLVQYLKLSIESEVKLKRQSTKDLAAGTILPASLDQQEGPGTIASEQQYQEALIDVMGSITVNVADYQKLEIIKFLFEKCPGRPSASQVAGVNTAPGTPYRYV